MLFTYTLKENIKLHILNWTPIGYFEQLSDFDKRLQIFHNLLLLKQHVCVCFLNVEICIKFAHGYAHEGGPKISRPTKKTQQICRMFFSLFFNIIGVFRYKLLSGTQAENCIAN